MKPLKGKLARLRCYQRHAARQRAAAMRKIGLAPMKPIPKGTHLPVSNRAWRTRRRIGKLHARIRDCRREALHQLSHRLVARNNVICLEDLSIKGMSRSLGRRAFRRSVGDVALGELVRQIEYKAEWRDRTVVKVSRWYPSSQICFDCKAVNHDLKLSERDWRCQSCNLEHDRNVNAARNLDFEGVRINELNACTARSDARDQKGAGIRTTGSA